MQKSEFIEFIRSQPFLDETRKKEIIDNVDWMSEQDREFLVKQITETATVLAKNEEASQEELEKIAKAIEQFQHEELPKLAKAEESVEKEAEQDEAEQLLKKL